MNTVRKVISKAAEKKMFARTVDRALEILKTDEVVLRIVRKSKLSKREARALLGMAALTGAEALLLELKKELPWDG